MIGILGMVEAGSFQSLFQLGVAIALAFVVAGPEVLKIIAQQVSGLAELKKALVGIQASAGGGQLQKRITVVETTITILQGGRFETVRVNSHTALWYVGGAALSFVMLVVCTVFETIPAIIGWLGVVIVGVIVLQDPIRVAWNSHKISKFASLVREIGGVQFHDDPTETRVSAALPVVLLLAAGSETLEAASEKLKAIRDGDPSFQADDAYAQT